MNFVNISNFLYNRPWAIEAEYFQQMIEMFEARKKLGFSDIPKELIGNNSKVNSLAKINSSGVLLAEEDDSEGYALISLKGAMVKYTSWMENYSGMMGSAMVSSMISKSEKDTSIKGIVFKVNSPGGTVEGTQELAQTIFNCSKPVVTLIDELSASAAYWVTSQSNHVFANVQTALIGSIGTLWTHVNRQGWYNERGMQLTHVVADKSKNKRIVNDSEPLSEEGLKSMKAILNPLNEAFLSSVNSGRQRIGVKVDDSALSANMYVAEQAIDLGLIDAIGGLQDAIAKIDELNESEIFQIDFDMTEEVNRKFQAIEGQLEAVTGQVGNMEKLLQQAISNFEQHSEAQANEIATLSADSEEKDKIIAQQKEDLDEKDVKIEELEEKLDKEPEVTPSIEGVGVEAQKENAHWSVKYPRMAAAKHNQKVLG